MSSITVVRSYGSLENIIMETFSCGAIAITQNDDQNSLSPLKLKFFINVASYSKRAIAEQVTFSLHNIKFEIKSIK